MGWRTDGAAEGKVVFLDAVDNAYFGLHCRATSLNQRFLHKPPPTNSTLPSPRATLCNGTRRTKTLWARLAGSFRHQRKSHIHAHVVRKVAYRVSFTEVDYNQTGGSVDDVVMQALATDSTVDKTLYASVARALLSYSRAGDNSDAAKVFNESSIASTSEFASFQIVVASCVDSCITMSRIDRTHHRPADPMVSTYSSPSTPSSIPPARPSRIPSGTHGRMRLCQSRLVSRAYSVSYSSLTCSSQAPDDSKPEYLRKGEDLDPRQASRCEQAESDSPAV